MEKIYFFVNFLENSNQHISFMYYENPKLYHINKIMMKECPSPRENLEFALSNPDCFEVMFK